MLRLTASELALVVAGVASGLLLVAPRGFGPWLAVAVSAAALAQPAAAWIRTLGGDLWSAGRGRLLFLPEQHMEFVVAFHAFGLSVDAQEARIACSVVVLWAWRARARSTRAA
jgi:hypothetical protein